VLGFVTELICVMVVSLQHTDGFQTLKCFSINLIYIVFLKYLAQYVTVFFTYK